MTFVKSTVALVLAVTIAAPTSAFAFGFGLGCSDLPELARAQGALQGETSCDMSVAEARRVVAAYGGAATYGGGATYGGAVAEPAPPRVPRRHHRRLPPPE